MYNGGPAFKVKPHAPGAYPQALGQNAVRPNSLPEFTAFVIRIRIQFPTESDACTHMTHT